MEDWQQRIENKIDKMADAIIDLARMEERMVTLFNRMNTYDKRQDEISHRVAGIEKELARGAFVEKLIWLFLASVVGLLVGYFK